MHSPLVFLDLVDTVFGLSGLPTNEFKQRAPRVLPEMPDRWLPTLANTVFCQVSVNNCAVLNKNNVSKRKIISFYEITVKKKRKFNLLCDKTETMEHKKLNISKHEIWSRCVFE